MTRTRFAQLGGCVVLVGIAAATLHAQVVSSSGSDPLLGGSANVLVPQLARCVWSPHAAGTPARPGIQISEVVAKVEILEQVATTTLDIGVENGSSRAEEVVLLIPVPRNAAVRSFAFDGAAKEPTAKLLSAEEARRIYHGIVAKSRDPGLLEFAGMATVRSSVFPVPPGAKQRVRLTYESLAARDGGRVDFVLPRSQLVTSPAAPWRIEVHIKSTAAISTVYSPSHPIEHERHGPGQMLVKLAGGGVTADPGPFLLSYLTDSGDITASLMAYPDASGKSGYFLLLVGLPEQLKRSAPNAAMKREVILVLDRSGSMAGQKIEQAKAAASQLIASLDDDEAFNIIDFSDSVERFAPEPILKGKSEAKALEYIASIRSHGGTALHDALVEALRQPHRDGFLPIVLFLTDGLPTVGERNELAIRRAAESANTAGRRIFTIGIGHDVNVPLLSKIARESRATETFIQPNESVEVKLSAVTRKLRGPVFVAPTLAAGVDGRVGSSRGADSAPLSLWERAGVRAVARADDRRDPHPNPLPEGEGTSRSAGCGPLADDSPLTTHHAPARIRDVMPAKLPDLFDGEQTVVLGRYVGGGPLELTLAGEFRGKPRTLRFDFDLDKATTRHSFVPRLWAGRKIASLVDEVRQQGAELGLVNTVGGVSRVSSRSVLASGPAAPSNAAALLANPAMKELIEEIVRLSKEFGVLTEYTAFLAQEGTDLTKLQAAVPGLTGLVPLAANRHIEAFLCATDLDRGAIQNRSGAWAVSQGLNNAAQYQVSCSNSLNRWLCPSDASMNVVAVSGVQQVADLSFFRRNGRWCDARTLDMASLKIDETVEVGTPAYARLADQLTIEGRNALLGMPGDILVRVEGRTVLVKAGAATNPNATDRPVPQEGTK